MTDTRNMPMCMKCAELINVSAYSGSPQKVKKVMEYLGLEFRKNKTEQDIRNVLKRGYSKGLDVNNPFFYEQLSRYVVKSI